MKNKTILIKLVFYQDDFKYKSFHIELPFRLVVGDQIYPYRLISQKEIVNRGLTQKFVKSMLDYFGIVNYTVVSHNDRMEAHFEKISDNW